MQDRNKRKGGKKSAGRALYNREHTVQNYSTILVIERHDCHMNNASYLSNSMDVQCMLNAQEHYTSTDIDGDGKGLPKIKDLELHG
jgi:hypothetical protein